MRIDCLFAALIVVLICSCGEEQKPLPTGKDTTTTKPPTDSITPEVVLYVPEFNADSAYQYVQKQVAFGPRVPNTKPHLQCAAYIEQTLKSHGLSVTVQDGQVTAYTGKTLYIKNIIARYKPEADNRVMLFAHWDTRPYADRDTRNRTKPIDGANDGGSGTAVLLEIARQIHVAEEKPVTGIDFIFFDAEDYGQPQETMVQKKDGTWCLGSQFWARNPPIPNYKPKYGILLDMVGAADAVFPKEGGSMYYAPHVVNKVWSQAKKLGYTNYFSDIEVIGGITDDHIYVNEIANIPSIDIVHYLPGKHDFGSFHHTHADNMSIIDRNTLKAVGQTVLEVIWREN